MWKWRHIYRRFVWWQQFFRLEYIWQNKFIVGRFLLTTMMLLNMSRTYLPSRAWINSPLLLLGFWRITQLKDPYTKKALTTGIMGRWIVAKKKAILPFFLLWAFVRIFVISLVFFPSTLADPLDPEVKVCGHNTWVSLEVQTCAIAVLVTMKLISLLYDIHMVRKWKSIDKSWMEMCTLPKGDAVAR